MNVDTSNKSMLVVIIRRLGEFAVKTAVFDFLRFVSILLELEKLIPTSHRLFSPIASWLLIENRELKRST